MSVKIEYTGIDGKSVSFESESVTGAFRRLSSIKGFNRLPSDEIAERVAREYVARKRT